MVTMMADASAVNQITSCLISNFEQLKEKPKRDFCGVGMALTSYRDHVAAMDVKEGDVVFLDVEVESGVWSVSFKNMEMELPVSAMEV